MKKMQQNPTTTEAMKYALTWTGSDEFGQMRKLARTFADELTAKYPDSDEIGVAYVQHAPGFEADKTMQLTSDQVR